MRSFEATFGISAENRLELVKTRVCGGLVRAEYWHHEEYDPRGVLVARYESYSERSPSSGAVSSGWCRYDADGFLSDRHDDLSEPLGDLLIPAA